MHVTILNSASIILAMAMATQTARAETVFIEPTQDNTMYQQAQGNLSNGSGDHLFVGRNSAGDIRRALISFKNLDAIPDHAVIQSVKLHLQLSREDSAATTLSLFRVTADWCEGGSHAAGEEDAGAAAQAGDATWIWRFWPDVPWNVHGGDFVTSPSSETVIDAIGAYTVGSSSGMEADVKDWIDHPETNFGWILRGTENSTNIKQFASRSNANSAGRPLLEVEYTLTGSSSDFSGLWFDLAMPGEVYTIYKTPVGWLAFFYGYSADGELLWLTSELVTLDQLVYGQAIEFPMLIGVPGTFSNPTHPSELQSYGLLSVIFDSCFTGEFTLDGPDGHKVSNILKLIGVEGTQCQ